MDFPRTPPSAGALPFAPLARVKVSHTSRSWADNLN